MTAQEGKRPTLTTGAVFMTVGRAVAVLIGYLLNVYLARTLGPASFGMLGVILTIVVWLEMIVAESLPLWVVRVFGRREDGPLLPRTYLVTQVSLSLLLTAGLMLASPWLADVFAQQDMTPLLRVASLDIPLYGLYTLLGALLLGSQSYGRESIATSGYFITKLVATILFVSAGLSVLGAILGSISSSVGGIIIVLILIAFRFRGRKLVGTVQQTATALDPHGVAGDEGREAFVGSATIAAMVITLMLAISVDLWVVKAMLPPANAGFYRAASLVAQVPITLGGGFMWALYSAYSVAHHHGETERLRHYIAQATRVLVAAGALWAALVIPTAQALLATVKLEEYAAAAAPMLSMLAAGGAFGVVGMVLAPTLLIEGHGKAVVTVAVGLVAAEVTAAIILVPRIGPTGASLALASAFVVAGVAAMVASRRRVEFPLIGTLVRLLIPAAVVAATAVMARPAPGLELIGWYVALVALYAVGLLVTRGLTREDLAALRGGLR